MDFIEQIYQNPPKNYKGIIFLDRDNTLIQDTNYLTDISQIKILPGVINGLKLLQRKGFIFIIVTNQAVIAKGFITIPKLKEIHNYLISIFQKEEVIIRAVYACPHHPNADLLKYRKKCECRKPGTAMIEKAVKTFSLDLHNSFMVGDQQKDLELGERMGLTSFHITATNGFLRIAKRI